MSASSNTISLQTRPLMPEFGVEILDVDLATADEETRQQIATLLYENGAIVLREQSLDPAAQLVFTRIFGIPAEHQRPEWCNPKYPNVYVISNKVVDGRKIGHPAAGLNWHTDMNYHRHPALCTVLHAIEVPQEGSDTLLADVCAAWNALPSDRQRQLEGLMVQHSFAKLTEKAGRELTKMHEETLPDVIHPLVRSHTHDGRKALYLGSTRVVRGVIGMEEQDAMSLVQELLDFATQERFVYRHKWRVGDVLVWDNRCTLHRGTSFDMDRDIRLVHRTWVRGEVPMA